MSSTEREQRRKWHHWAYLNDEGKKLWGDVFPKGIVPVRVMFPRTATLEGQDKEMSVFMINHEELTPEQIDLILTKLSNKFHAPKDLIKKDMLKSGLPLRRELTNGSGTDQMGLFL
jgi:hypothetical protein